jgi:hypothetical protein
MRINNYEEAFYYIGVNLGEVERARLKQLEEEGYKEKNICFAIWKASDKIMQFKGDNRFWSVLTNEVRKIAFKSKV